METSTRIAVLEKRIRLLEQERNAALAKVRELQENLIDKRVTDHLLIEREKRLRLFFDHAPVALAMFDRGMRYIHVSQRWLIDYGLEDRDVRGMSHYDVFPEIPEAWKDVHLRGLSGEVLRAEEDLFVRADGSKQWQRWEVRPWYHASGGIGGIVIFTEDITDRKQAEHKLLERQADHNRAESVAKIGSWRLDIHRNKLIWSDENHKIFGIPKGTPLTYEKFLATVHPDDREHVHRHWTAALKEGAPYDIDHRIIVDGQIKWVREKAELEFDNSGNLLGGFGTSQDITKKKNLEEELRRAKDAAEEANRAKSEFLANMSHEIRTPMTVIMTSLELLSQGCFQPEHRDLIEMAENSSRRLLTLIDEILDFSRIEARKVVLAVEPFNLPDLIENTQALFALQIEKKGLQLTSTISPQISENYVGSPDRIGQVLVNLIGNAIKFTEKGEIALEVGPALESGQILFSVRDTGIGIPENKRDLLFQAFSQVDSSLTRNFGGTGLGLAICKRLVELMGGSMHVESAEGEGSTFSFMLPLAADDIAEGVGLDDETAPISVAPTSGLRILLVEDDPTISEVMEMILRQRDWEVITASDGWEAIAAYESQRIDLILMDLQMPFMDGLNATRHIRKLEQIRGTHVPIVALTAHARSEDQELCISAGMDAFLTKPVISERLYAKIESLVSRERTNS